MKNLSKYILSVVFACQFIGLAAAPLSSRQEYINLWKETAVNNMKRYGIPASIILAQGILESANGNSPLALNANNHFGIKCHDWTGDKYYHDDDAKQECFRKYANAAESYADHAIFLKNRSRYAFLFEYDVKDYKSWAYGLKKAGYATNPNYPALLIKIIEDSGLSMFDDGVIPQPLLPEPTPEVVQVVIKKPRKKITSNAGDEIAIYLEREVQKHPNNINFITAQKGDTPQKIADALQLGLWQIIKYNDFEIGQVLTEGETVFIQPKRRAAKQETYTAQAGDNFKNISQLFGVKLKRLLKLNQASIEQAIPAGSLIKLR